MHSIKRPEPNVAQLSFALNDMLIPIKLLFLLMSSGESVQVSINLGVLLLDSVLVI